MTDKGSKETIKKLTASKDPSLLSTIKKEGISIAP